MNYFPNVPKVAYEGPDSTNPFSFKYYDPDRLIHGNEGTFEICYVLLAYPVRWRSRSFRP